MAIRKTLSAANEDDRPKRRCMNIRSACSPQGSVTLPTTRREGLFITAHLAAVRYGPRPCDMIANTTQNNQSARQERLTVDTLDRAQ